MARGRNVPELIAAAAATAAAEVVHFAVRAHADVKLNI